MTDLDPQYIPENNPALPTDGGGEGGEQTPEYVSKDDFSKLQEQYKETSDTLRQLQQQHLDVINNFNTVLTSQQAPQQPTSEPGLDVSEIKNMIETGEGAEAFVQKINNMVEHKARKIVDGAVTPLQQQGSSAISTLAMQHAEANLPYFKDFKDQIQSQINQLDPGAKSNPEVIHKVYQMVVGENVDKIFERKQEEILRKQKEEEISVQQQQVQRQTQEEEAELPAPSDYFVGYALDEFNRKGGDGEKFARQMGFPTWNHYVWAAEHPDEPIPEKYMTDQEKAAVAAAKGEK
jgi:hypothetical protein